jgi:hypothetical protein
MKRPKISAGKWKAYMDVAMAVIGGHIVKVDDGAAKPVASIYRGSTTLSRTRQKANAVAIAALPDLLEALEHVHLLLSSPPPNKPGGVTRPIVREALRKAGYVL